MIERLMQSLRGFVIFAALLAGCMGDQIKANQDQLAQQQAQLDQLKQQIVALQSQPRPNYSTASLPPGSCDETVLHQATQKGGQLFASNDFGHALGYYQDAVTACPKNARAQLNLARTCEAMGDRTQAIAHYQLALDASATDNDTATTTQAREALHRLQK